MAVKKKKQRNPFEIPTVKPITNAKQAAKALKQHMDIEAEISHRIEDAGIHELTSRSQEIKAAVTEWAVESETARIEIDDAHHATLIAQFYDSRFIGTAEDLRGDEKAGVIPLRTILRKKLGKVRSKEIWMQVTRRHVDRDLLEEVISEGIISVDDVAPAFVEKEKKPYLRVFTTGE